MKSPTSIWYAGRWRTPEGVVKHRQLNRERQRQYRGSPSGVLTQLRYSMKQKEARFERS